MSVRSGYRQTEIGEIPKDWRYGTLVTFAMTRDDPVQTGPFGAQLHASDYVDEGVPLILIRNVVNGRIVNEDIPRISRRKATELERYRLRPGDIVFSRVGSVGRAAVVRSEQAGWLVSGQMLRVRLENPEIETDYLAYVIASHWFQKALASRLVGSTRKSINTEILQNLPLIVPPIVEQQKIAFILSKVDDAIQNTDEIIAKTQQLKKGLMQQLLTKGIGHTKFKQTEIGEIPEEWKVVRLGELVDVLNGRFFPSEHYTDTGIKLLRPGNLHEEGFIDWNQANTRYLPVEYASSAKEWIVRGNEIVINLTAQSLEEEFLGRACITSEDEYCLLNQRIARITPRSIDAVFLFWVMKSGVFRRFVDRLPGGTKIKHIYTRELLSFQVPYPPLAEQRRIAKVLLDTSQKIAYEKDLLSRLHSLKKGLMQVLLTGRVRVKVN
jgi:type I restriction enzyme S subunit